MKKQLMVFMVLVSTALFAAACSNNAYQDAMDKGMQSLGEKDYRQAALHFEMALKEKKDDSETELYFEQASLLSDAQSAYDEQRYDEALSYITNVVDSEDSLLVVQKDAEDLKNLILEEQEISATYSAKINNIQTLINNGEYKTAQTQLQIFRTGKPLSLDLG